MISFKTSTGKSSSRSGPLAAFSLPFGVLTASSAGGATSALAGTLARHIASTSLWIAAVCAASGEGANGLLGSSSEGKGDAVLAVPGVDGGEEAILDGEKVAC